MLLVLALAAEGAVVWRLPPAATDLADPPEGGLTVEAPGSWQVGGFEVTLTGGEGEERMTVTHPDAVAADEKPSPLDGGRGLILMRALVDRLDFVKDDGRHRVVLEKQLAPQPHLRLLSQN